MKQWIVLISLIGLSACVSNGTRTTPTLRPSSEASAISARSQLANRTFAASPGGQNLAGSIYFASDGTAIQAAEGQGTQRLTWAVELGVEGIRGPALCVSGQYYNIVTDPPAVDVQRDGGRVRCAPVSDFLVVQNTLGNGYGLGTRIR